MVSAEVSSDNISEKPNGSFDSKDSDKDLKKKKNRCTTCRKKVGLTGNYHCLVFIYYDYMLIFFILLIYELQVLNVDVVDYSVLFIDIVTSMIVDLTTEN